MFRHIINELPTLFLIFWHISGWVSPRLSSLVPSYFSTLYVVFRSVRSSKQIPTISSFINWLADCDLLILIRSWVERVDLYTRKAHSHHLVE